MGERRVRNAKVEGSIPFSSTTPPNEIPYGNDKPMRFAVIANDIHYGNDHR